MKAMNLEPTVKYVPYMTLDDDIEVTHTLRRNPEDPILVHIEEPSEIYGFKTLDLNLDKLFVISSEGMSDSELADYVDFCRCNRDIIFEMEFYGGSLTYASNI